MRTFVAIELDEAARAVIAEAAERLRAVGAEVRWVDPALYHLTVKFLGEIPSEAAGRAGAIVAEHAARAAPFSLSFVGVSLFPSAKRPRVVAARIPEVPPALADLAAGLDGAFAPLGVAADGRDYRPHLTLGRMKSRRRLGELVIALGEVAGKTLAKIDVDHLTLVESVLSREGPRYTPLARASLGGG